MKKNRLLICNFIKANSAILCIPMNIITEERLKKKMVDNKKKERENLKENRRTRLRDNSRACTACSELKERDRSKDVWDISERIEENERRG